MYRDTLLVQRKYFFFLKQAWRVNSLRTYLRKTIFHKVFQALQLNVLDQKRLRTEAQEAQRVRKLAADALQNSLQAWETRCWWAKLAEALLSRQTYHVRVIQRSWRCFARKKALTAALHEQRRKLEVVRNRSAVVVESFCRMCAAKNRVAALRAHRAEIRKRILLRQRCAVLVQSLWRRFVARMYAHALRIRIFRERQWAATIALQAQWRRCMAAQAAEHQRRVIHSAVQMKIIAKSLVAQEALRKLRHVRFIQSWWRSWLAKRCHALMLLASAKGVASTAIQTLARAAIAAHELTRRTFDYQRSKRVIQIQAAARQRFAWKELRRRKNAENQLKAIRAEQAQLIREEEANAQAQRLQQLCDTEAELWWAASKAHSSHSLDVQISPLSTQGSRAIGNECRDLALVDGDSILDSGIQEPASTRNVCAARPATLPDIGNLTPESPQESEHPPKEKNLALPTIVIGNKQSLSLEAAIELPFQDKFAGAAAAARRSAEAAAALQTELRTRLLAHVAKEAAQRGASRLCRVEQANKEARAAALLQAFFLQRRKRIRGRTWRKAQWKSLRAGAASVQRVWRGVCARRQAVRLVGMVRVAQALCQSFLAFNTLRQRRCEKIAAWQRRQDLRAMFARKEAVLDELRRVSLPQALVFRRQKLLQRGIHAFASQGSLPAARALRDRWRLRLLKTCLKAWRKLAVLECLHSIRRHKKNVLKGLNLRRRRQVRETGARRESIFRAELLRNRPAHQSTWSRGNYNRVSDLGENNLPRHLNEKVGTTVPHHDFICRARYRPQALCWDGELTYTKALTTSYNLRYVTQTKEKVYRAELNSLRQWIPKSRAQKTPPIAHKTSSTGTAPRRDAADGAT